MPEITISRSESIENGNVVFTVTLSEPSSDEVRVAYRIGEGTAVAWSAASYDYSFSGTVLIIPAGQTQAQISVNSRHDTLDEVDESIWVDLFNPVNATLAGGEPTLRAVGIVQDDDGTGSDLSLFVSSPTLIEGSSGTKKAVFEVHLSRPHATDVTLAYTTTDGSAKAGSDYVAKSGTVTFLAGQTVASVEVDIRGDLVGELSEFFSLVVTPTGDIKNGTSGSTGTATILDNDTAGGVRPVISIERGEGTENNPVVFKVSLSKPTDEDVLIAYRTIEETGVAWSAGNYDYTPKIGTLVISAGQTVGEIVVDTRHDILDEVDEAFWLELANPRGGVLAGGEPTVRALGVARDDDGTGSNLALFVSDPTVVEGNSGIKKAVFEIHLSRPHSANLTLGYTTADGSAKAGTDYVAKSGTVTFLAGQTVASVEVDIRGDVVSEPSEFFSLVVAPNSDVKNGTAASTGVATIVDNDSAAPTVSIQRADATESNGLTFQVTLSKPSSSDVVVDYRMINGTAIPWSSSNYDFTPQAGKLTIAAGQTVGWLSIDSRHDNLDEVDESFWVELYNPVNAVLAGGEAATRALGVIRDDDGTGSNLSLFVSSLSVAEGNAGVRKAVFEVHLSRPHATNLSMGFKTADGTAKAGTDYVAKSGVVLFRAGQTVATVEVDIKSDRVFEPGETFSLIVTPPAGNIIKNLSPSHVGIATIRNDDSINEILYGTAGNDYLDGREGNDYLYGYAGHDWLVGGPGADWMRGAQGNDIYVVDNVLDVVDETGGNGRDTVRSSVDFSLANTLRVKGNVEDLTLLGVAKFGTGNSLANKIVGNGYANVLAGGAGADTLDAGAGNDVLVGGAGGDRLLGGAGIDTASYSTAVRGVTASLANARANKGDAAGDVFSSIENLTGGAKADTLTGNGGGNVLDGGKGKDKLSGGAGADKLVGGLGADQLSGGNGKDIFIFRTIAESTVAKAGRDIVSDFRKAQKDKIDLTVIDAKSGAGNQAFDFIGKAKKFTGDKGELRYETKFSATFVYGDVNGDRKSDFSIQLKGVHDLKAGDFVL